MITAELRSCLGLASSVETSAMPRLEAFDSVLPLPLWRDIVGEHLRFRCPVARFLAAQNHLDGNFLASRWQTLMLSSRENTAVNFVVSQSLKSSDGDYSTAPVVFSLGEETQLDRDADLLSWTLGERGLRRWLAVGASSNDLESDWVANRSTLYGLKEMNRGRTAQREFNWQYSYGSSDRLMKRLEDARGNSPNATGCSESSKSSLEKALQPCVVRGWAELLPLVLAQIDLVDAMALTPQRLIPAADQLSVAWDDWLSIQVLNNLCLSQMAESPPIADIACLTRKLLNLSIRVAIQVDPVKQF